MHRDAVVMAERHGRGRETPPNLGAMLHARTGIEVALLGTMADSQHPERGNTQRCSDGLDDLESELDEVEWLRNRAYDAATRLQERARLREVSIWSRLLTAYE